jgi:HK97 family phage major capsid protein
VPATDALLARYQAESEERSTFMEGLVEQAEKDGRDLTQQEMELLTRTRERIHEINTQVEPLREAAEISRLSRERRALIAQELAHPRGDKAPTQMEYRSAGAYICDYWKARTGNEDAAQRIALFERAASHQTTADNPGLLPEQIILPVVNWIDTARPTITALGPRALPSGSWARPQITQHTSVAQQSAEKGELVSQKMTIGKVPVTAHTYGGYVNVSRQNVDWSVPAIMDLVVQDLAAQYAIQTEAAVVAALVAGATAGATLPTGALTVAQIVGAIWGAAGSIYTATHGIGGVFAVCGPDMLGVIGPVFPPVNPQNGFGSGFNASNFGQGLVGNIAGIPLYVSAAMPTNTVLVLSGAAAEVYEDRIGALQVIEPSVLGVQVAYAGYLAQLILLATGIIKIVKTP